MLDAVPAFTAAETIGARLDALDTAPLPPTGRWTALAATVVPVVLTAFVGAALLGESLPFHHGVSGLLEYCPL